MQHSASTPCTAAARPVRDAGRTAGHSSHEKPAPPGLPFHAAFSGDAGILGRPGASKSAARRRHRPRSQCQLLRHLPAGAAALASCLLFYVLLVAHLTRLELCEQGRQEQHQQTWELDPQSDQASIADGDAGTVAARLAYLEYEAFRRSVDDEFEIRRGPGMHSVKFRPRSVQLQDPWAFARLAGSVAQPRQGWQSFVLPKPQMAPGQGQRTAEGGRQLIILVAFDPHCSQADLVSTGRWWVWDGALGTGGVEPLTLSVRGLSLSPMHLKQRLRRAYADMEQYRMEP